MTIASEIAAKVFPEVKHESPYQKDVRLGKAERCKEITAMKLKPVREALSAIAGPCDKICGGRRCIDEQQYTIGAEFSADAVCYPCIANAALALFEDS